MTPRLNTRFVLIVALVAATGLGVSACGKRGTLDRPPPMWGHHKDKTGADAGAQRTTPERKGDPTALSPDANNRTIAQDPMDGVPQGPTSGPGNPSNLVPHN
ncbi:MAG TPA: hypothetical protein VG407_16585 [Caulobacteraceae bacterium]|jgi:hypothetical protein|nr:hypothetical protein [Caulobacteraceae bacterium]